MIAAEVQLGRLEGGRVARNPLVWLALALTALWVHVAEPVDLYHLLAGYGMVLPAFVTMVVLGLATRRSRRTGAEELLDTLPAGPVVRTVALGTAACTTGIVALTVTVALLAYRWPSAGLGTTDDTLPSGIDLPSPNLAQLLQGPMALVVVGVLGVALASWMPTWVFAPALVLPAMAQILWFGIWNGEELGAASWWWPWSTGWVHGEWVGCVDGAPTCSLQVSGFDGVTPWWHLGYLVALAVLLLMIAVLRHRRDRTTWNAFGLSVAAVVALAAAQAVVYERFVPVGAG